MKTFKFLNYAIISAVCTQLILSIPYTIWEHYSDFIELAKLPGLGGGVKFLMILAIFGAITIIRALMRYIKICITLALGGDYNGTI